MMKGRMTDQEEFIKSLYKELYHFENHAIVQNQASGQICVEKVLSVYSIPVYQWLKKHHDAHVCTVLDYWQEGNQLVVVEELISGNTLEYLLDNHALDHEQKKDLLIQVCEGVSFLHHADPPIIHRDLKPANIMVMKDGRAKIIDYDAAKIYKANEKKDTVLIGTEGSAAPEQYGFGSSDERTDIYAIGVLIKEMFPDDREMQKLAAKCTKINPDDRFQHVEQILKIFESGETGQSAFTLNIPGFRTGNVRNMLIASFFYAVLIISGLSFQFTDGIWKSSTAASWIGKIMYFAVVLGWIDLFTGWSGIYSKLPWMKSEKPAGRAIGYLLSALLILFVIVTAGTAIANAL